jgi:hypothetical protein
LNWLFKEINIKKFYNSIPKIDLLEYSQNNLWHQFINNIYWKERKIFYRKEISWWNCHYWSVFLKNIFDTLKSRWLDIQNRIFVYDEDWWHSSVIIKFQWEIYLADYGLFNQMFNKIVSPISDLDWFYQKGDFVKVSFNRKNDVWVHYFDEIKDFVYYINSKRTISAAIEFNPRLEQWKEKKIKIQFFKKYLSLSIDWEEKKYLIKDDFILSKMCKDYHEVLDCLLKWILAERQQKCEMKLYLDMIRDKINPKKIYEIFC